MTITKISKYEAYEMYDQMLDECSEEVNICGYTYSPSHALKNVDPIAYRCGFNDYFSSLEDEYEIEE